MFDWLYEGRPSVYVLLFLVGGVLLVLWWQHRNRRLLLAYSALAGVTLLYFLLDILHETPREKVEATIKEMADAASKHDLDRLFRHVSDNFKYQSSDRKAFRERVRSALDRYDVKNIHVKDLRFLNMDVDAGRMTVRVGGTASTNQEWSMALPCELDFVREGDGEWRMRAIRFYNPVLNAEEWSIPGF
ncbi:MAG TPA: hypothetical protein VKD72_29805 [Gemmataceae bacterium]|nr:hypothetical protein [Gemmataceae bacterium]